MLITDVFVRHLLVRCMFAYVYVCTSFICPCSMEQIQNNEISSDKINYEVNTVWPIKSGKHEALITQWCFNVEPPSSTLAQH